MAKPSSGLHTPRPSVSRGSTSSCSATRSSVGSTSSSSVAAAASKLPLAAAASNAKVVAKCLAYDDVDDLTLPVAAAAASTLIPCAATEEGLAAQGKDLAPLLDLPDPDVAGDASTTSVDDDARTASADSSVTEVAARAGSLSTDDTPAPLSLALPEEIGAALSELRCARGLSPRSTRLLSALGEAAAFELAPPAATARRLRRAAFWGKVRVAVLAATLASVAAVDVALAAYLYARRVNERDHVLPPT